MNYRLLAHTAVGKEKEAPSDFLESVKDSLVAYLKSENLVAERQKGSGIFWVEDGSSEKIKKGVDGWLKASELKAKTTVERENVIWETLMDGRISLEVSLDFS